MNLIRKKNYNPFTELEKLHHDFDRLFDISFSPLSRRFISEENSWMPSMDVYESKDDLTVKMDVPGLSKEEISVSVEGDRLTVKGQKKEEKESKDGDRVFSERVYGSFQRTVTLPSDVDASKAKADYKNGVLELKLPKREDAKPKQIDINVK